MQGLVYRHLRMRQVSVRLNLFLETLECALALAGRPAAAGVEGGLLRIRRD